MILILKWLIAFHLFSIKIEIIEKNQFVQTLDEEDSLYIEDEFKESKSWLPRVLRLVSTGKNRFYTHPHCSPLILKDIMTNPTMTLEEKSQASQSFLTDCEDERSQFFNDKYTALIDYYRNHYPFHKHPEVKSIIVHLPDGRKVEGFLAIHPDQKKRPFVIARCGLFCNREEGSTVKMLMSHLFDEGGFNVMVLANVTGKDFSRDNGSLAIGGFDEGRQVLDISQKIVTPSFPYHQQISDVHVVGVSLGSHGTLYTGLYSSYHENIPNTPISSVLALCPVVELEPSFRRLYREDIVGKILTLSARSIIKDIIDDVPVLKWIFENRTPKNGEKLFRKIETASVEYYKEWTQREKWPLAPFTGVEITEPDQFWSLNSFSNHSYYNTTPSLVVGSWNDPIVEFKSNGSPLEKTYRTFPSESHGIIGLNKGSHCAINVAYGWGYSSQLLTNYILSHSQSKKKEITYNLENTLYKGWFKKLRMKWGRKLVHYEFKARKNKKKAKMVLTLFSPWTSKNGTWCGREDPYRAPKVCYDKRAYGIKLKHLGIKTPPRNHTEAMSVTRRLNANVILVDKNDEAVEFSGKGPVALKFSDF